MESVESKTTPSVTAGIKSIPNAEGNRNMHKSLMHLSALIIPFCSLPPLLCKAVLSIGTVLHQRHASHLRVKTP